MKSKYLQLQQLLFAHRKLSRQELIRLSGFNPRTVDRCMETLASRQLALVLTGKNGTVYEACCEQIEFAIFTVTAGEIFFIITDIQGIPRQFSRHGFAASTMSVNALITALLQECQKSLDSNSVPCAIAIDLQLDFPLHRRYCARIAGVLEAAVERPVFCRNNCDFLLAKYLFAENISDTAAAICSGDGGTVAAFGASGFADDSAELWHKALLVPPGTVRLARSAPLAEMLDFTRFVNSGSPGFAAGKNGSQLLRTTVAAAAGGDADAMEILTLYAAITAEALERIHQCGGANTYLLLQMPPLPADMVRAKVPHLPVHHRTFTPNERIFAACSFFCPN